MKSLSTDPKCRQATALAAVTSEAKRSHAMFHLSATREIRALSFLLLLFSSSHGNAQEFDKSITCSSASTGSRPFVMEWSDHRTNQILMDGEKYVDKSASPLLDKAEVFVTVNPTHLSIFHFNRDPRAGIVQIIRHRVDRVSGKATVQFYDNLATHYECAPGKSTKF